MGAPGEAEEIKASLVGQICRHSIGELGGGAPISVLAVENLHVRSHSSRGCSEKKTNTGGHRL